MIYIYGDLYHYDIYYHDISTGIYYQDTIAAYCTGIVLLIPIAAYYTTMIYLQGSTTRILYSYYNGDILHRSLDCILFD